MSYISSFELRFFSAIKKEYLHVIITSYNPTNENTTINKVPPTLMGMGGVYIRFYKSNRNLTDGIAQFLGIQTTSTGSDSVKFLHVIYTTTKFSSS